MDQDIKKEVAKPGEVPAPLEVKIEGGREVLVDKKAEVPQGEVESIKQDLLKEAEDAARKATASKADDDKNSDMQAVERKIQKLLTYAKTESPEAAIKEAEKMNDPLLLDLFHDRLVQELGEGLKKNS